MQQWLRISMSEVRHRRQALSLITQGGQYKVQSFIKVCTNYYCNITFYRDIVHFYGDSNEKVFVKGHPINFAHYKLY